MTKISIDDKNYELLENYRDGFDEEEFKNRVTEDFYDFDYILGDYAYSKLRLKGFYNDDNKNSKEYNKISKKDEYLKENCAYECKYFLLKKI